MQTVDLINTFRGLAPALHRTAHALAVRGLEASGRLRFAKSRIAARGDLIVLTLHRIVPDDELSLCQSPRGMVLRESLFVKLLNYLRATTVLVSPGQAIVSDSIPDRPHVLITFDDGWIDNYEIALPHLSKANIQAHFFVVTSLTGKQSPFWPEQILSLLAFADKMKEMGMINGLLGALQSGSHKAHPVVKNSDQYDELLRWLKQFPSAAISQWIQDARLHLTKVSQDADIPRASDIGDRLMTWDQLQLLVNAGHGVGSHTCSHAILPQLDPEQLAWELQESHCALQENLYLPSSVPLWISYPNGSASLAVAAAARNAQYQYGFINTPGLWQGYGNSFLIPRINVWDGTLVDADGVFCERQLEYALFWKAHRATA